MAFEADVINIDGESLSAVIADFEARITALEAP